MTSSPFDLRVAHGPAFGNAQVHQKERVPLNSSLPALDHSNSSNGKSNRKPYTEEEVILLIDFYAKYSLNGLNFKTKVTRDGFTKSLSTMIAEEMQLKFPNSLKVFDKENIRKKVDEIKMEYMVFRYLYHKTSGNGWNISEGKFDLDSLDTELFKKEYRQVGGQTSGKADTFKKLMKPGNLYMFHFHEMVGRNFQVDLDFSKISPLSTTVHTRIRTSSSSSSSSTSSALLLSTSVSHSVEPELVQQQGVSALTAPRNPLPSMDHSSHSVGDVLQGPQIGLKRKHSNDADNEDDLLLGIVIKLSKDEPNVFRFNRVCELIERYRVVRRLLVSSEYDYEYKKECLRQF